MTIDALRRLAELLTDAAGYATAVDKRAIAADLIQAADAAQRLADDEQACCAQQAARHCPRRGRPSSAQVPA